MFEGLKGKPVHVPGEMRKPIETVDRKPGDHFYRAGRLMHIGADGKEYVGFAADVAIAA